MACGLAVVLSIAHAEENVTPRSPYDSHNDGVEGSTPDTDDEAMKSSFRGSSTVDGADRSLGRSGGYDDDGIGTKGSKGSGGYDDDGIGTKGSKGSKGSKGDNGGGGGRPDRCNTCGQKQFLNVHLEGTSLFGENSFNQIIPNSFSKTGSTLTIYETGLSGYVDIFDTSGQQDPYSYEVQGVITGSCTLVATIVTKATLAFEGQIDRCLYHCTVCVTYLGDYCTFTDGGGYDPGYGNYSNRERSLSDLAERETWEESVPVCCPLAGFVSATGDVILDLILDENVEVTDPTAQISDFFGQAGITSGLYDAAGYKNGAFAFIEYTGEKLPESDGVTYKVGLKLPFTDEAVCKLQDYAYDYVFG